MAARPRPPFWHRRRLGWANALGFALTLFLGLWLLLAVFRSLLPGADALEFPIPAAYVAVCLFAQVAVVALGALIVFRFMWQGADFTTHTPRLYVFGWTCAGLLFYLCQGVVLLKFGARPLPNVAAWAADFYWHMAPVGLAAFGLMAYVNLEIPPAAGPDSAADDADYDPDAEWDEERPGTPAAPPAAPPPAPRRRPTR